MSNSIWNIFPTTVQTKLVNVLPTEHIFQENEQIKKLLKQHLFARCIQVLGEKKQLVDSVRNFVSHSSELAFLHVHNLPLYALIRPQFIDAFCRNGLIYGLSVNCDVNLDNTVALLPNCTLLLSLNTETYYRLGLVGQPSILNRKKSLMPKYRVVIQLTNDCFKPGKKNYQRVEECLRRCQLKCNMVLKWVAPQADISAVSSLEQYFTQLQQEYPKDKLLSNIRMNRCFPSVRPFTNRDVALFPPMIDCFGTTLNQIVHQYIEWLSAQVAQIAIDLPKAQSYDYGDMHCVELKGFFVESTISQLLRYLEPHLLECPRAAIIVHGFEDSAQCWSGRNNEHYKQFSGENLYAMGQLHHKVFSWCIADQFDFGIEKL